MADATLAARAARRLRHDLGRYIRFWAPEEREADSEALRERLARDVLSTRSGPAGVIPATAVFDAWLAEEGHLFPPAKLEALRRAVDALRSLAPRLPELGRPELEELDRLTRTIAEECRRLAPKGKSR